MLEGALILVLTVVLVLVVAGGVVAVLALSRRSADEWKGVIKRESEEIAEEV
ncbi:MAG: ABC transporter, partial [Thermobifida sp.]|nr:ABC transporter [Thermobifida sp.]